jgi:hypothetical protein
MAAAAGPQGSLYVAQLEAAAALVAEVSPDIKSCLAYCSRSGPPAVPWLTPDIDDALRYLAADGTTDVIVVPIGFVSDHIEVRWDLDVEAAATAKEVGLTFHRSPRRRSPLRRDGARARPGATRPLRSAARAVRSRAVARHMPGWLLPRAHSLGSPRGQ